MALQRDYAQFEARGYKARVRLGTLAPLPSYTVSGDFQTITAVGLVELPDLDGVTPQDGDDILYFSGVGGLAPDNGIYTITQVGSTGVSGFILQRRAGFSDSSQIAAVSQVSIAEGTLAGTIYNLRGITEPITLGSDDLVFEAASGGGGAGVIALVPNGETAEIPENQKMLHNDDLTIGEITTTVAWNGSGDTGGDWATSGTGAESGGAAFSGTNGWDTTSTSGGTFTKFNNGSVLDVAGTFTTVSLQLQPKLYPANANLTIQWQDAGQTLNGSILNVEDYTSMALDTWQRVVIPIEAFNLVADVQYLVLTYDDAGAQQHWVDDVELQEVGGAELNIDGSLEQIETSRNFSENVVPIRTRRVIEGGEQMLHSGPLRIDGVLQVDGLLTDVTPSTANQLLATLGEVVDLDEFLVGGGSPMQAKTPEEVRGILDVLPSAESTPGPFGTLGQANGLEFQVSNFNAQAGGFYAMGASDLTMTLPVGTATGETIALIASSDPIVVSQAPDTISVPNATIPAATPYDLPSQTSTALYFFTYYAPTTSWLLHNEAGLTHLQGQNNKFIGTDGSGDVTVLDIPGGTGRMPTAGAGLQTDTSFSAELNRHNPFDFTNATARTITLPAAVNGDRVSVGGEGSQSTGVIQFAASASFLGPGGTFLFSNFQFRNHQGFFLEFEYKDSSWVVVQNSLTAMRSWGGAANPPPSYQIPHYNNAGQPDFHELQDLRILGRSNSQIKGFDGYDVSRVLYDQGAYTGTSVAGGSSTNDWNLGNATSLRTSAVLRPPAITGTGDASITGIDWPLPFTDSLQAVRLKLFVNDLSTNGQSYIFKHDDVASLDRNRFICPDGKDLYIEPGQSVWMWHAGDFQAAPGWIITPLEKAPGSKRLDNTINTTDATVTTIARFQTTTDVSTTRFNFTVSATHTDTDTDTAFFDVSALIHRDSGSTLTEKDVSFLNGPYKDAGAASWNVTLLRTGTVIEVQVTGEAAHNIRWRISGMAVEDV